MNLFLAGVFQLLVDFHRKSLGILALGQDALVLEIKGQRGVGVHSALKPQQFQVRFPVHWKVSQYRAFLEFDGFQRLVCCHHKLLLDICAAHVW